MNPPLPERPTLDGATRQRLADDYERYKTIPLPPDFTEIAKERYDVDLTSTYGGYPIRNPFGKASGQLSLQPSQVKTDAESGLGFVVLKTVIAQDESGKQSMSEWAIHETKMVVERIRAATGEEGWTVTWKGRGWHGTFEEYIAFFKEALEIGAAANMVIVPSCKYHLPVECEWRVEEYRYTTRRLAETWASVMGDAPMPIEKDFSPTLAGDDRSNSKRQILEWMSGVPRLIRESAPGRVRVGLKLMNAMFEDAFQIEMLRAAADSRPDWLVYANRLFDPTKEFEEKRGVAYGGPDLSARNLRVLAKARELERAGELPALPPISATGDILSGRKAAEYALLGAENFQMHTLFQLPNAEYAMAGLPRAARALHRLLFHPNDGYLAWMRHFAGRASLNRPFSTSDLRAHRTV